MRQNPGNPVRRPPLYTPEERVRRDNSVWTLVQGVLAPLQFLIFLVSLVLVLRYLSTGAGDSPRSGRRACAERTGRPPRGDRVSSGRCGPRPFGPGSAPSKSTASIRVDLA